METSPELVVMNDYLNVGQTNRVWRMVDGQLKTSALS